MHRNPDGVAPGDARIRRPRGCGTGTPPFGAPRGCHTGQLYRSPEGRPVRAPCRRRTPDRAGRTVGDERVFVAIAQIVGRGLAPPRLRAAAIEVLARLGHVRIGSRTRDSRGNPVQEFTFVDPHARPGDVQPLMFDTRTAEITEQRDYFNGKIHFKFGITVLDIANTVPAAIREAAVLQR